MSEIPLGSSYLRFFAQGGPVEEEPDKWAKDEPSMMIPVGGFGGATQEQPSSAVRAPDINPDNVQIDIAEFYPDLENPVDIEEDTFEAPSAISSYIQGAIAIPETVGNYFLREGEESGDIDFIGGSQLLEDAATMGGAMWEGIKSEPMEFLKDMTPGLGQYRAYNRAEELREDADLLEMEGDLEGAENLRQLAVLEMIDATTVWPMAAFGGKLVRTLPKGDDIKGPLFSPYTIPDKPSFFQGSPKNRPLFSAPVEAINALPTKNYTASELREALEKLTYQVQNESGQMVSKKYLNPRQMQTLEGLLESADVATDVSQPRSEWLNLLVEVNSLRTDNPANLRITDRTPHDANRGLMYENWMRSYPDETPLDYGPLPERSAIGVYETGSSQPWVGTDPSFTTHFNANRNTNLSSKKIDTENPVGFSRYEDMDVYEDPSMLLSGEVDPVRGRVLLETQSDFYNSVNNARSEMTRFFDRVLTDSPENFMKKNRAQWKGVLGAYNDLTGTPEPNRAARLERNFEEARGRYEAAVRKNDSLPETADEASRIAANLDMERAGAADDLARLEMDAYTRAMRNLDPEQLTGNLTSDVEHAASLGNDGPLSGYSLSSEYKHGVEIPDSYFAESYELASQSESLLKNPLQSQKLYEEFEDLRGSFREDKLFGAEHLGASRDAYPQRAQLPTPDFLKNPTAHIDMQLITSLAQTLRDPSVGAMILPDPRAYKNQLTQQGKPNVALERNYSTVVPKRAERLVEQLNAYYGRVYGLDDIFGIKDMAIPKGRNTVDTSPAKAIVWDTDPEILEIIQRGGMPFSEGGEVSKTAWEELNGY